MEYIQYFDQYMELELQVFEEEQPNYNFLDLYIRFHLKWLSEFEIQT